MPLLFCVRDREEAASGAVLCRGGAPYSLDKRGCQSRPGSRERMPVYVPFCVSYRVSYLCLKSILSYFEKVKNIASLAVNI